MVTLMGALVNLAQLLGHGLLAVYPVALTIQGMTVVQLAAIWDSRAQRQERGLRVVFQVGLAMVAVHQVVVQGNLAQLLVHGLQVVFQAAQVILAMAVTLVNRAQHQVLGLRAVFPVVLTAPIMVEVQQMVLGSLAQ